MSKFFRTRGWKNHKGFLLLPAAGWIIIGGIAYMTAAFWGIIYYMADKPETVWF